MKNVRNILIGFVVSAVLVGIIVSCGGGGGSDSAVPTYTVGGNITGATGTVVLKLNGGSDTPMAAAGAFTFPTGLVAGTTYNVQVVDANDRCTVTNGAGTMGATNITNVAVTCGAQAAQMVIRSARLNGAQQNPPVTTSASGVGGIIVDPTSKAITGGITFSGLTPLPGMYHIHQAPAGTPTDNGPVIIGLTLASDGVTAIVPVGTVLTGPQYTALLAGELYFNVHTQANQGGEIRGQINAQGGVLAAAANLDGTQEVNSTGSTVSTSTATGKGTVIVDAATRSILITYITHNVASATMAHIHSSPSGAASTGPIIVGFNTLQANFDTLGNNLAYPPAGSQMTAQNLTDFGLNYLYFNVHSGNLLCTNPSPPPTLIACGAGEIRGNFGTQ